MAAVKSVPAGKKAAATTKGEDYGTDSIQWLKGLEGVRKRPTVYIGSLGDHGVFHMMREIVENSVDEHTSGYNTRVNVGVFGKGGEQEFIVTDEGRGMPVGFNKKEGRDTLTILLTELHAGGKFNTDNYKKSRGLNGMGSSCVNALSSEFDVWSYRNNTWWHQRFECGKPVTEVVKTTFPSKVVSRLGSIRKDRGTIVRWKPDYTIVGHRAGVKTDELLEYCDTLAMLNTGLKIRAVTDKGTEEFLNKNGPKEFLARIISDLGDVTTIGSQPFIFENEELSVAIKWSDYDAADGVMSFVNGALTEDGGTHMQGLYTAVTKAFRAIKGGKSSAANWTAADIRAGVVGYVNYFITEPEFDGQTKSKLVSVAAEKSVAAILEKPLGAWLASNKSMAAAIVKRAEDIKKANDRARELAKQASSLKKTKSSTKPIKLLTCTGKTAKEDIELYLVEGDSAAGTARQARFAAYQMLLKLKGKILNTSKLDILRASNSNEFVDIIRSITDEDVSGLLKAHKEGRAWNPEFSLGRVILLADADEDGNHITALLIAAFQNYFPQMFERGMIYRVDAPLYYASRGDVKISAYSQPELQEKLSEYKGSSGWIITRAKGWGEISDTLLREIAFDPRTRKLIKLEPMSKKQKAEFESLMGTDSSTRKELLGL